MAEATLARPDTTDPMAPWRLIAAGYLLEFANLSTQQAYGRDLRIYFDWCLRNGIDPMAATRIHIKLFIRYMLEDRNYTPAGLQRIMTPVKGFYTTCVIEGHLLADPSYRLKTPKVIHDPTTKPYLNRYELARVLDVAEATSPTLGALANLMAVIGLRVSAACRIDVGDFQTSHEGYRVVRTHNKGDKFSWKTLPIPMWRAMDAAIGSRTAGPLLVNLRGERLSRRAAGYQVERLGKLAGLRKHLHPHMLRRTCATLASEAGVPTNVIRDQLDHASESTTLLYIAKPIDLPAQAANAVSAMVSSSR